MSVEKYVPIELMYSSMAELFLSLQIPVPDVPDALLTVELCMQLLQLMCQFPKYGEKQFRCTVTKIVKNLTAIKVVMVSAFTFSMVNSLLVSAILNMR